MPEAARVSDLHTCPKIEPGPVPHVGGPILPSGSTDIEIEDLAAVRITLDKCFCAVCSPDIITEGCGTVLFNNKYAVRKGDKTDHGGVIVGGSSTVEIGIPGDGITVPVPKAPGGSIPPKKGKGEGGKGGASDGGEGGKDSGDRDRTGEKGNNPDPDAPKKANQPPVAIIHPIREIDGNYVEHETVELYSFSYDPEFGTNPGAGIAKQEWRIVTPINTLEGAGSKYSLTLLAQGSYKITLTVFDDEGLSDTTETTEIIVGGKCDQHTEEMDFLAEYVDSLIAAAGTGAGAALGFDWAGEMLAHWKSGAGGTVKISPSRVRGLFTVIREARNTQSVLEKNILQELNLLRDGQTKVISAPPIERSFYALSPAQFLASGGSTLRSEVKVIASRAGDSLQFNGVIKHYWTDGYNWDGGKSTNIPWPSTKRFPWLVQNVQDDWFNLLRLCRGIGKDFALESTWYASANESLSFPVSSFALSMIRWADSDFTP